MSKGYIPLVNYLDTGGESVLGWLRVGPETEKEKALPSSDFRGTFHDIWVNVYNSRERFSEEYIARTAWGVSRRAFGEVPVEFVGEIRLDDRVLSAGGLLYRSGYYRGNIMIADSLDPETINRNQFTGNSWLFPGIPAEAIPPLPKN